MPAIALLPSPPTLPPATFRLSSDIRPECRFWNPARPTTYTELPSVDMNLPIGCGGVAVFPNDVIVGDIDGVVVIPHHLAEEIAVDAAEQEGLEAFIFKRIEEGAPLTGT